MQRITLNFWIFFAVSTVSSGLLGRYLAAMIKGYVSLGITVTMLLLAVVAVFSITVLLRIVKAVSDAKQQVKLEAVYLPHGQDEGSRL